ncbi:MAG: hypothetical protein ABSC08_14845, partial [Bryobacteraceae bacterium]
FGEMLRELDGGNGPFTTVGGAIARAGSALTRFAEFAVPQKLSSVFFRYGLQLLYAIALVLIVVGAVLYKEAETAGWVVLLTTAGANIASWLVGKWLFRQKTKRRIVAVLATLVLLGAAVVGLAVRYERCLPQGAWKAPLHSLAEVVGTGCETGK